MYESGHSFFKWANFAQIFSKKFERVMGIGPTYFDWQPNALPLCYTRIFIEKNRKVARRHRLLTSFVAIRGEGPLTFLRWKILDIYNIQNFFMCRGKESDLRPLLFQSSALPLSYPGVNCNALRQAQGTSPRQLCNCLHWASEASRSVGAIGLEPMTLSV